MKLMKEKEAFFSSADMSVEVWNQASGQNHVLQVENQFFNLARSQMENMMKIEIQ